jgi:hypothetical protein
VSLAPITVCCVPLFARTAFSPAPLLPSPLLALTRSYITRMADRVDVYADQGGALGHDLRFVASAVSHVFLAFGDVITLHRRLLEVSGYTARVAGSLILGVSSSFGLSLRFCCFWFATDPLPQLHFLSLMVALEDLLLGIDAEHAQRLTLHDPHFRPASHIAFDGADIVTPCGRCLAHDLSVTVEPGSHLLITGPNTAGKSAVFRVLEDLWPLRRGYIESPLLRDADDIRKVFIVPQVTRLFLVSPSATLQCCWHALRPDHVPRARQP